MTKDEALRFALEALEAHADIGIKADKAITAIKAALEAKDKPVAYIRVSKTGNVMACAKSGDFYALPDKTLLYTTPPQQEAKDEPVALKMDVIVVNLVREGINKHRARELAEHFIKHTTTPPQRKPLTDEEIQQIFIANSVVVDNGNAYMVAGLRTVNIARAIEAAHGIKGEA